jgi:hypothetical protein
VIFTLYSQETKDDDEPPSVYLEQLALDSSKGGDIALAISTFKVWVSSKVIFKEICICSSLGICDGRVAPKSQGCSHQASLDV